MSDGRNFTLYTSTCDLVPANMSSNAARMYMKSNAEALMERDRKLAQRHGCDAKCFDLRESGTSLPQLAYMQCDQRKCRLVPGMPDGLGLGRK